MPTFEFIRYGVSDGLATLTVNRAPFNVLDIPTMMEINQALDLCRTDAAVRLLLITGSGEKAFSAGVEVADHTPGRSSRATSGARSRCRTPSSATP